MVLYSLNSQGGNFFEVLGRFLLLQLANPQNFYSNIVPLKIFRLHGILVSVSKVLNQMTTKCIPYCVLCQYMYF